MPYPNVIPGSVPIEETEHLSDPSGFTKAGFNARQTEKACECIQLMMREWIDRSAMPKNLIDRLPIEVPLYTTGTPIRGDIMSSDTAHQISRDLDTPLRIRPHSDVEITLGMDTSFLKDSRLQIQSKIRVLLHMVNLVTSQFSNPMNYARDSAWHFGIANNVHPPASKTDGFYMRVEKATTGLSAPDGCAVIPHPSASEPLDTALRGALRSVPVDFLWRTYGECITVAERSGYCLNIAEEDELIRRMLPDDADRILAHPAFRELKEGEHAIAYTAREGEVAYMEGFEIRNKGPLFPDAREHGASWSPTLYDVRGKAFQWTQMLLGKTGNVLHSTKLPFIASKSLYGTDLKEMDAVTVRANPKIHALGQKYQLTGTDMIVQFDRVIKPKRK